MSKQMLVGLDGSVLSESVVPYVKSLAESLGADVTLLQVVNVPEDISDEEPGHIALEAFVPQEAQIPETLSHAGVLSQIVERNQTLARDYLTKVQRQLQTEGLNVGVAVTAGRAATGIVRYAEKNGSDIIALATHGRSGLSRWAYGSVAEDVLHQSKTPVLLVHPTETTAPRPDGVCRVLVPLDGSPLAEAALPLAQEIAQQLRVPMTLIRAVETPAIATSGYGDWSGNEYQQVLEAVTQSAELYLFSVADRLRTEGLKVETSAPFNFAASAIEDYASKHPGGLVVMASHGRTGIIGTVLGSVARRVVRNIGSPVLVVRPQRPNV